MCVRYGRVHIHIRTRGTYDPLYVSWLTTRAFENETICGFRCARARRPSSITERVCYTAHLTPIRCTYTVLCDHAIDAVRADNKALGFPKEGRVIICCVSSANRSVYIRFDYYYYYVLFFPRYCSNPIPPRGVLVDDFRMITLNEYNMDGTS